MFCWIYLVSVLRPLHYILALQQCTIAQQVLLNLGLRTDTKVFDANIHKGSGQWQFCIQNKKDDICLPFFPIFHFTLIGEKLTFKECYC